MMKSILALVLCGITIGCAETDFYSLRTGKRIAHFQGDMTQVTFSGGGIKFAGATVTHSTATLAGGQAFKMGADSLMTGAVSMVLAGGAPWAKVAGAGVSASNSIFSQLVPVVAPAALQAHH